MPHRSTLLDLLQTYAGLYPEEQQRIERFRSFVERCPDCFERTLLEGHVTGSAFILSRDQQRLLLTHHRKLNAWLQPGGHADGDPDVLAVALREAHEESGIADLAVLDPQILDIDIHRIPERVVKNDAGMVIRTEPEHLHYDVRFALHAHRDETLTVSEESHDLAWVPLDRLADHDCDESILRMAGKWQGADKRPERVRGFKRKP